MVLMSVWMDGAWFPADATLPWWYWLIPALAFVIVLIIKVKSKDDD